MREMLKVCTKILDKGSLLMFDCGANTPKVKDTIVENCLHYLTLKTKKVSTYKNFIKDFDKESEKFYCNGIEYSCTKKLSKRSGEFLYIYFSKKLCEDQLHKKEMKFKKRIAKGDELIKKAKKHKAVQIFPSNEGWVGLYPEIQRSRTREGIVPRAKRPRGNRTRAPDRPAGAAVRPCRSPCR